MYLILILQNKIIEILNLNFGQSEHFGCKIAQCALMTFIPRPLPPTQGLRKKPAGFFRPQLMAIISRLGTMDGINSMRTTLLNE